LAAIYINLLYKQHLFLYTELYDVLDFMSSHSHRLANTCSRALSDGYHSPYFL